MLVNMGIGYGRRSRTRGSVDILTTAAIVSHPRVSGRDDGRLAAADPTSFREARPGRQR